MLSDKTNISVKIHYNQEAVEEIKNTIMNIFGRTLSSQEKSYFSHCIQLMKASQEQKSNFDEKVLSEEEIKHYILLANSSLFSGREYSMLYDTIHPVITKNDNVRKVAV